MGKWDTTLAIVGVLLGLIPILVVTDQQLGWSHPIRKFLANHDVSAIGALVKAIPLIVQLVRSLVETVGIGPQPVGAERDRTVRRNSGKYSREYNEEDKWHFDQIFAEYESATPKQVDYMVYDVLGDSEKIAHQGENPQ